MQFNTENINYFRYFQNFRQFCLRTLSFEMSDITEVRHFSISLENIGSVVCARRVPGDNLGLSYYAHLVQLYCGFVWTLISNNLRFSGSFVLHQFILRIIAWSKRSTFLFEVMEVLILAHLSFRIIFDFWLTKRRTWTEKTSIFLFFFFCFGNSNQINASWLTYRAIGFLLCRHWNTYIH